MNILSTFHAGLTTETRDPLGTFSSVKTNNTPTSPATIVKTRWSFADTPVTTGHLEAGLNSVVLA